MRMTTGLGLQLWGSPVAQLEAQVTPLAAEPGHHCKAESLMVVAVHALFSESLVIPRSGSVGQRATALLAKVTKTEQCT